MRSFHGGEYLAHIFTVPMRDAQLGAIGQSDRFMRGIEAFTRANELRRVTYAFFGGNGEIDFLG